MAQTSDELKQEISQTREQMAETADALAYKADVPSRTKDWVGDKKDAIVSAVGGATSAVGATPDGADVAQSAGRLKRLAEQNPVGLAIGGAAVGFIAGLLAPSTRIEDERIGPMADEVKATAAEAGREVLDRGKDVVQEAGSTAIETAKERGREEGEELSESLQEKARELAPEKATTTSLSSLTAVPGRNTAATSREPGGRHPEPTNREIN
jgi:gas vesicle protein